MQSGSSVGRAPGKILWLGGYSVLERPNVSMVSAVDAYAQASVVSMLNNEVRLSAQQLRMSAQGKVDAHGRMNVRVPSELLLLKTAAEMACRYAAGVGARITGISIETSTDERFAYGISGGKVVKSGLGSSAAITVATVKAVLDLFGVDPKEHGALHKISQAAHSVATGKVGSGFDVAASAMGSIVYTRYSPEILDGLPRNYSNDQLVHLVKSQWDYTAEKLRMPGSLRPLFATFGSSMITTKALKSVSDFKMSDPHTYADLMKEINFENVRALKALDEARNAGAGALEEFIDAFDRGRSITKKLGVLSGVEIEPDDCTKLIEESKEHGAMVAKLPGAGGMDAIAALCADSESLESLRSFWLSRKGLRVFDLEFARSGAV